MKSTIYKLLAILLCPALSAYGADNEPDAARTVSERVVEPSPDVATARRYADLPVSYATGSASISLPLMTLSTPTLSVSLGLAYRCEAKRVDEPAGWVGLGWTLSGLGSVSRQICGMPDDIEKDYMDFDASEYDGKYTEKYFDKLLYNEKDAKADRYTIVTPEGYTASFFFKERQTIFLNATELDVWHEMTGDAKHRKIDKFRVRTPDGIFYEFAEKDTVEYVYHAYYRYSGMPNQNYKAVTAWHLTKIVNPEKTDSIEISYSRGCTWKKYHGCSSLASRTYTHSTQPGEFDHSGGSGGGSGGDDDDDGYKFIKIDLDNPHIDDDDYVKHLSATMSRAAGDGSYGVTTYLNPALPTAIKSKNGTIRFIFEQSGDRNAMRNGTANRLKKITLASPDNATVRSADFGEGRLGDERRTLASLRINGDSGMLEGYSFAYRDMNRQSRDIFGYPNGRSLSTSWESVIATDDLKLNKSRRWDGVNIHGGLLWTVTTATGITTSFDYEPSRIELENGGGIFGNEIVIGTRIRSITATDNATQRQRVRTFDYFAPELSADISQTSYDVFLEPSGTVEHLFNGLAEYYKYDMSVVFTGSSRLPGMPLENTRIYYGAVEETVTGTDLDSPVRTRYEYDLSEAKIYSAPCGSPIGNDGYEADGVRILGFDFYTTGGNAQVMRDTFRPHATTYYFEECLGCEPMLSKKITYRQSGGEYVPHTTETHTYAVCDRRETKVGLHYDHLAFRVAETATIRNTIDNVGHVNYGDIKVKSKRIIHTGSSLTRHYGEGRERTRRTHYHYDLVERPQEPLELAPWLKSKASVPTEWVHPGFGRVGRNPFSELEKPARPYGVTHSCLGDSVSEYVLYIGESPAAESYEFEKDPWYLPVARRQIAHGKGAADTVDTRIKYGRFYGGLRPVSEGIKHKGMPLDSVSYTAYSCLGLPTAMTRRDGSEYAMTWDAYGNLTSRMLVGPGLESRYTYKPLVGCTSITYPSGRRKYFSYDNGRLSQVRNSANEPVASYGYTMANPGLNWGAQGENAVTTTAYTAAGKAVTKAVYDGFGMKTADIAEGFGGGGVDVVTATEYDALDRAVKLWQPAPGDTTAAAGFYGDTRPWTDYVYDTDGSQNIVSSTAPGKDMLDHAATNEYLCNTQSGELRCRHFVLEGDRLVDKGAYADAALDVVRATDADGHRVLTFTDWRGRTVLVRKVLSDSKYIDPHTLYDAWGDVLLVLQPEGVAAMQAGGSWDVSDGSMDDVIEKYAYVYRYDEALRPVYAKLPGCDPVTTAYDPDGLAAYTVDGNLRAKGRARFTLYDAAARPVVTGICDEPSGEVPRMRAAFDTSLAGLNKTGYTTDAPLTGMQVYTATYYDNYDFVSLPPFAAIPAVQMPTATAAAGLVTATLDRVLEGTLDPRRAKYVATVNTYDAEERPIKTVTAYHDTDICAVSENSYNIDGTVSTCTNTLLHPYDGHNDSHVYSYDAAGRLLKETASYDGGEPVTVQQLSYNAVGQLASNDLGAFAEAYTYNVRGAMTGRKSDVFEQTISFSNHFDRLYNGSIGMITDKLTGGKSTTSGYSYDNAGRLTSAMIFLDGKTRPTGYTYDLNGNITALNRLGYNPPSLAERIDDLVYQYDGNKVRKITDKSPVVISEKTMNFVDGADEEIEYTYDRNGNMTSDANRGIAMFWDNNNRLEKVNFGFDKYLSFTRSATGRKLSMTNRTPAQRPSIGLGRPWIATTTVTHYYGAYEYQGGKFSRLNTATGYRDSLGTHVYVRDYQGNIRAVVRRNAQGVVELEQATYYYPYGMSMAESTNPTVNRYKYTGKELLTDHGVNILDYGPRPYDPTTGIWLSVDKKSRNLTSYSHYVFCNGDPINYKDPNGEWSIKVSASEDRGVHPYATFNVLNIKGQIIYRTIVKVQGLHRDRTSIDGDTPCGLYDIVGWEKTGVGNHDVLRYGPNHLLRLNFISGEGADKRTGILAHGGRAQFPELWNTLGCIRIADEDIKELKAITDYLEQNDESEKPETLEVSNSLGIPVTFQDREDYQILYYFELPELIVTPNEDESTQTETK